MSPSVPTAKTYSRVRLSLRRDTVSRAAERVLVPTHWTRVHTAGVALTLSFVTLAIIQPLTAYASWLVVMIGMAGFTLLVGHGVTGVWKSAFVDDRLRISLRGLHLLLDDSRSPPSQMRMMVMPLAPSTLGFLARCSRAAFDTVSRLAVAQGADASTITVAGNLVKNTQRRRTSPTSSWASTSQILPYSTLGKFGCSSLRCCWSSRMERRSVRSSRAIPRRRHFRTWGPACYHCAVSTARVPREQGRDVLIRRPVGCRVCQCRVSEPRASAPSFRQSLRLSVWRPPGLITAASRALRQWASAPKAIARSAGVAKNFAELILLRSDLV